MYDLVEMMTYKRPQGSDTQREFCNRFLEPIMGLPDQYGNYVVVVVINQMFVLLLTMTQYTKRQVDRN